MTRSELLALCRYYKGERECPPGKDWAMFERFWHLERRYVENAYFVRGNYFGEFYDERRKFWETKGLEMCLDSFPDVRSFIDSDSFSVTQKGMLAFMVIMAVENNPMGGPNFILNYGRSTPVPQEEDPGIRYFDPDAPASKAYSEMCRYFHGEEESPFDAGSIQGTFWDLERAWIKRVADDEQKDVNLLTAFALDFPDGLRHIEGIPNSLKAFIWDQYEHWYGYGSKGDFQNYLFSYLENAPHD